jgi:hypothetical protein
MEMEMGRERGQASILRGSKYSSRQVFVPVKAAVPPHQVLPSAGLKAAAPAPPRPRVNYALIMRFLERHSRGTKCWHYQQAGPVRTMVAEGAPAD